MEMAISLAAKDKPFRQQFPLHLTFFFDGFYAIDTSGQRTDEALLEA